MLRQPLEICEGIWRAEWDDAGHWEETIYLPLNQQVERPGRFLTRAYGLAQGSMFLEITNLGI